MFIGKKIRDLRKSQKMKLLELAQKSGVQIATLSRIEHEKMTGTLESHIRIAKALGVDVTALYSDIIREDAQVDVHSSKKSSSDVFVHSNKSSYEILTGNVLKKQMMPMLLKVEANGKTNSEQNKVGSEKFIFVTDGKLNINIAGETYPLSKGNSLYFDASLSHFMENKGKAVAKAIVIVTPVEL